MVCAFLVCQLRRRLRSYGFNMWPHSVFVFPSLPYCGVTLHQPSGLHNLWQLCSFFLTKKSYCRCSISTVQISRSSVCVVVKKNRSAHTHMHMHTHTHTHTTHTAEQRGGSRLQGTRTTRRGQYGSGAAAAATTGTYCGSLWRVDSIGEKKKKIGMCLKSQFVIFLSCKYTGNMFQPRNIENRSAKSMIHTCMHVCMHISVVENALFTNNGGE